MTTTPVPLRFLPGLDEDGVRIKRITTQKGTIIILEMKPNSDEMECSLLVFPAGRFQIETDGPACSDEFNLRAVKIGARDEVTVMSAEETDQVDNLAEGDSTDFPLTDGVIVEVAQGPVVILFSPQPTQFTELPTTSRRSDEPLH